MPSNADLSIASTLGNNAVGFGIVNNAVTEIYVVVEPHRAEFTFFLLAVVILALQRRDCESTFAFPDIELNHRNMSMITDADRRLAIRCERPCVPTIRVERSDFQDVLMKTPPPPALQ